MTTKQTAGRLYYHKTDGGAEYLCSRKVRGTCDEGDMHYAVARLDGKLELLRNYAVAPQFLKSEKICSQFLKSEKICSQFLKSEKAGEQVIIDSEGRRIISQYLAAIGRVGGSNGVGACKARTHEQARAAGLASAASKAARRLAAAESSVGTMATQTVDGLIL